MRTLLIGGCLLAVSMMGLSPRGAMGADGPRNTKPAPGRVVTPAEADPNTPTSPNPITISVSDSSNLTEGGLMLASFTVSISDHPAPGKTVRVGYRTVMGTTNDFTPTDGTLTFKHGGSTSFVVTVHALEDHITDHKKSHTFYLTIFDANGGKIVRSRGVATVFERNTNNGHLQRGDLPKAVLNTLDHKIDGQGAHDFEYRRIGKDDYIIFYTDKNGKRFEIRIDDSGTLVAGPRLEGGAPAPVVKAEKIPPAVVKSFQEHTKGLEPRDIQYAPIGQDDFLINFTSKDGKHMRIRVDDSGAVVSGPSPVAT